MVTGQRVDSLTPSFCTKTEIKKESSVRVEDPDHKLSRKRSGSYEKLALDTLTS